MKLTRYVFCVPLIVAGLTCGALAQDAPGPRGDRQRERRQTRRQDGSCAQSSSGIAGDKEAGGVDRIFSTLDANSDGKIDKKELARKGPQAMARFRSDGQRLPGVGREFRGQKQRSANRGMAFRGTGAAKRGFGGGNVKGFGPRFGRRGPAAGWGGCPWSPGCVRQGWQTGRRPNQGFGQGRFGRGQGWQERQRTCAFQPPGARMGRPAMGRGAGLIPGRGPEGMAGPQRERRQMAFRMLDSNADGRLEPPEIAQKIEMLERLLRQSERQPIDLQQWDRMGR